MIRLPGQTKAWDQNNRSDVLGTMYSSFGIDLTTHLGKTKVTPRTIITNNGTTNLGCPVAFKQFSGKIYAIAGTRVFINPGTKTETAFVEAALGSDPTDNSSDYSDLEVFISKIWTAGADTLRYTDGATWGKIDTGGGTSGLTATVPHKLLAFQKTLRLYVTDGNRVRSSDGSAGNLPTSGTNTYTLSGALTSLNIVSLLQTDNLIWILTINPNDTTGYVITWDGITADTYTNIIPLDSRGVAAGIILNGVPHIMTVDGRLQKYNGQIFVDVKNPWLPVLFNKYLKNPLDTANDRWIHPNGLTIVNGRINALVNNENYDTGTTINENLPSGIWEYDDSVGWYHKLPLSMCLASDGVIKDFGQNRLSRVGALLNLRSANNSADTYVGNILVGATYFSDASTAVSAIWTNDALDSLVKFGNLVTVKIPCNPKAITDSWNKVYALHKKFLNATDRIVVSCRTSEDAPVEATITWTSTTTFTTSTDLSTYAVGDQVEVIQGTGSGLFSAITAISVNAGTYTVTTAETYTNVTGTAKARFQHWVKCGTIQDVTTFSSAIINKQGAWIQLKIGLYFTGDNSLQELIIINEPIQLN